MTCIERIFELIDENKTTPMEVAKATGLSPSNFSEWKKGNNKPGAKAISKLAAHFNVSTDYLQGFSDDRTAAKIPQNKRKDALHQRLIKSYDSLSDGDEAAKRRKEAVDILLGLSEQEDE